MARLEMTRALSRSLGRAPKAASGRAPESDMVDRGRTPDSVIAD